MGQEPASTEGARPESTPASEDERRRLYRLGAMAQSFVPSEVGDELRRTRKVQRGQLSAARAVVSRGSSASRTSWFVMAGYWLVFVGVLLVAAATSSGGLAVFALLGLLACTALHTIALVTLTIRDRRN
jgi:hypothetical protein